MSTAWLSAHLDDPSLRVLDATVTMEAPATAGDGWTVRSGRADHDAEHLPRAQYADLVTAFSGPVGRFPRPSARQAAAALQGLGIDGTSRVVVHDRSSSVWAARLWWVLRSFGIDASVLDGGFAAWRAEGRPTTADATVVASGPAPDLVDRGELFVGRDEVLAAVRDGRTCLVNALDTDDFEATGSTRYVRPGRIPGSLSVPASGLLSDDGTFLPEHLLRQRFAAVLARPGRKVLYCGGGVAACADALALTLLGEQDVAVYDASYEEWAADPSLPVEVGDGGTPS